MSSCVDSISRDTVSARVPNGNKWKHMETLQHDATTRNMGDPSPFSPRVEMACRRARKSTILYFPLRVVFSKPRFFQ